MGVARARKPPRGIPATRKFGGKVYRWDGTWTEDRSAAMATAETRREVGIRARVTKTGRDGFPKEYHLYVRGKATRKRAPLKARPKRKPPRKRRKSRLDRLLDMDFGF